MLQVGQHPFAESMLTRSSAQVAVSKRNSKISFTDVQVFICTHKDHHQISVQGNLNARNCRRLKTLICLFHATRITDLQYIASCVFSFELEQISSDSNRNACAPLQLPPKKQRLSPTLAKPSYYRGEGD